MRPYRPTDTWWTRTHYHRIAIALILSFAACLIAALHGAEQLGADFRPLTRPEQVPALPAGRYLMVEATGYCPCSRCTDGDRITADGTRTNRVPYAIAADRSFPIGTLIYVPAGLGYLDRVRASDRIFRIDDRGGSLDTEASRYGVPRIDLRFRDHASAVRFGRRAMPIFICNPSN